MTATVEESLEILSSVDSVWALISDIDRDGERWGAIRDVKIVKREGSTIEREATVGPRGHKTRQTLWLEPKKTIQLRFVGDGLKGERRVSLVPLGKNETRVDVSWRVEVDGIPAFVHGLVKHQLSRSTQDALKKFKEEAEGRGMMTMTTMTTAVAGDAVVSVHGRKDDGD
jgi:uncharacterized membrane protein